MKKISFLNKLVVGLTVLLLFFAFSYTTSAEESQTSSGIKVVQGFSDVPKTHPYYVAISYLSQAGILSGYQDGTFKPDSAINRAEVLKVIMQSAGINLDEALAENPFPDVDKGAWFAKFVHFGKKLGIVKGNDKDGTFTPARQVNKAEFIKMLLTANNVNPKVLESATGDFKDVPADAWFAPYLKYAASIGIVRNNGKGELEPVKPMNRGEVADSLYLLTLIHKGKDTQFLLTRAEAEMAQIEVYVTANRVDLAKKASELAVDLTQQAYKNMPENKVVLGAGKLAKAYDMVVNAFVLGIQKKFPEAAAMANQAIDKAGEAWEVNNATQPIAKHIKDRAREILAQVGGKEE